VSYGSPSLVSTDHGGVLNGARLFLLVSGYVQEEVKVSANCPTPVCKPDSGCPLPRPPTTLPVCQLLARCTSHIYLIHCCYYRASLPPMSTTILSASSVCMPDSEDYLPRHTSIFYWFIIKKSPQPTIRMGRLLIVPLLHLLRARRLFKIGPGPGADVVGLLPQVQLPSRKKFLHSDLPMTLILLDLPVQIPH
jgi:hypothetical protein